MTGRLAGLVLLASCQVLPADSPGGDEGRSDLGVGGTGARRRQSSGSLVGDGGAGSPIGDGGAAAELHWVERPSPIAEENLKPGDTGWRIALSAGERVGAYADATSFLPGELVTIRAAAITPMPATWALWRMGYYGGAGGRQILSGGPVWLPPMKPPILDVGTGAVEADWPVTFSFPLPADATTGIYLLRLATEIGETYALLVVRSSIEAAPLVWPLAVNTYEAYNSWGGTGLYDNHRHDWPFGHAFAASFDRPYLQGDGAGQLFSFDRWFLFFAESQGWDIDYISDVDLDADPSILQNRAAVILQGHSEYWSRPMRETLEAAILQGTGVAAFGANDIYWQVRLEPSPTSTKPRRMLVGYKEYASIDPIAAIDPALVTTRWRDAPLYSPENALLGTMFGAWLTDAAPLAISGEPSWLWQGASVNPGDLVANLVVGEADVRFANGAEPASLVVVGNSLVGNHDGEIAAPAAVLSTAPSGAIIFAAGTWGWGRALAQPGFWDPRIQVATSNLIQRFLEKPPVELAPILGLKANPPPVMHEGSQVSTVTTALPPVVALAELPSGDMAVAAGDALYQLTLDGVVSPLAGGVAGDAAGPAAAAQFRNPRGLAVATDGSLYIADAGNAKIKVLRSGIVHTLAGSQPGFADGFGSQARFTLPLGIALLPDGTLSVADTWSHRIRAVSPEGDVTTWAGNGVAGAKDGPGASANLYFPLALTTRFDGTIIFAESEDGLIRQVSPLPSHDVTTVAGQLGLMGTSDGALAVAAVGETAALAAWAADGLLLLDGGTWSLRILRPSGVQTLVQSTRAGEIDGVVPAASLWAPGGLAVAGDDAVWIADWGGPAIRRVTLP